MFVSRNQFPLNPSLLGSRNGYNGYSASLCWQPEVDLGASIHFFGLRRCRGVSTLWVTRRFNSFIAGGLFGRLRLQSPIAAAAPNLLGRFCEMAGLRDLHHRLLYSWHFPTILPKHVSLD